MPNIKYLINHLKSKDNNLYNALIALSGQSNAPNPNVFTSLSDASEGNPLNVGTTFTPIPRISVQLNTNGNYLVLAAVTMNGDANTGSINTYLFVEGFPQNDFSNLLGVQNDVAKAFVGTGGIFNFSSTYFWSVNVTKPIILTLQATKALGAGTGQISHAKLFVLLLP